MKHPHKAASLRSKFMRSPESYKAVFSDTTPLNVWPKIVHILKRVDVELQSLRPQGRAKFLKSWRYIIAFMLVSESFGKYTFSAQELAAYDIALITPAAVESIWHELLSRPLNSA